jgi:hypothetical protein
MGFIDILYNVLSLTALGLLSARARIAFDERRLGRVTFCISFGLFVVRSLVLRWLSGASQGVGLQPDSNWRDFLSSTPVALVVTIFFFIGLAWTTLEEYHDFRARRRERKRLQSELKAKDREIDRLNQKAVLKDGAVEATGFWDGRRMVRPRSDRGYGKRDEPGQSFV